MKLTNPFVRQASTAKHIVRKRPVLYLVASLFVIAAVSVGVYQYTRPKPSADVNSVDTSTYAFISGKVTLASDNSPAKGFMVIIDNNNSPTDDDGNYSISIPNAASIGDGTGQAAIHFVRIGDNSQWQQADNFEQGTYLSPGLFTMDFSVSQIALDTKVNTGISPYDMQGGQTETISLKAILYGGTVPIAGKTVNFAIEGKAAGSAVTDNDGNATISYTIPITLTLGMHNVTMSFDGTNDLMYNSTTRTVSNLNVKVKTSESTVTVTGSRGGTVTMKALLYAYGKPLAGKLVTFTVEGLPAGSGVTDATGTAIATTPFTIPTTFAVGTHNVTASFDGTKDPTYGSTTRTTPDLIVK